MKMYKNPTIEVTDLKTASLMQGITVSTGSNADPNSPPPVNAPKRGDIID